MPRIECVAAVPVEVKGNDDTAAGEVTAEVITQRGLVEPAGVAPQGPRCRYCCNCPSVGVPVPSVEQGDGTRCPARLRARRAG